MSVSEAYRDFPPGWGHVLVPTSSRRAALAGISLYTASRRRGVWLQGLARLVALTAGPKALPGKQSWEPPLIDETWDGLLDDWRSCLGPFDAMAVYRRRQASRDGFGLLLLGSRGSPLAFLKLRKSGSPQLLTEQRALALVAKFAPGYFSAPEVLASGGRDGWSFLALAPLPGMHRRPRRAPLEAVAEEVGAALACFPRPSNAARNWLPMHGDFTPWNLREARGSLHLIDWEDVDFGPPGSDLVLYQAAEAALGGRPRASATHYQAVEFWIERLRSRPENGERAMRRRLLAALQRMREAW